jgi:hypothetical protein
VQQLSRGINDIVLNLQRANLTMLEARTIVESTVLQNVTLRWLSIWSRTTQSRSLEY